MVGSFWAVKIAPIFFNTMEDAGALPIECDVSMLTMGQVINIHPFEGKITDASGATLSTFTLSNEVSSGRKSEPAVESP